MWGRNLSLYLDLYLDLSLNLPLDPPSPCALKQKNTQFSKMKSADFYGIISGSIISKKELKLRLL